MWRDEVRAFSVATRTTSWAEMFAALGEEGHPAVWYALLRVAHALTGSQYVLPIIAAVIGIAAAYVILRYAPFTTPIRLLAVFGTFLAYELTVVARNYGIGVLLIVAACALWDQRRDRPWVLAIVLALLANTSVHASVAAAVIAGLWVVDALRDKVRSSTLSTLIAMLIVGAGIVLALWTARPPAEMAYSVSLDTLTPAKIFQALLVDPGYGLRGTDGANLVASGELPWARIRLDKLIVGRILVNLAVLSLLWGLRKNRVHIITLVIAILSFEFLFRVIYPGALRHQALLAFLIFGICWLAVATSRDDEKAATSQRVSLGLLPLFAMQAVALPFVVVKHVTHAESQSRSLAQAIEADPRLSNAILMSEPDPLMESMPYYAANPVYFPRQREFDFRAYFDRGERRQQVMTLGELVAVADSVGCATRRPVLISMGYRSFHFAEQGRMRGPYGVVFTWNAPERIEFARRTRPLRWFPGATSDENYRTYELRTDCR